MEKDEKKTRDKKATDIMVIQFLNLFELEPIHSFIIITVLVLIWNFITAHENACLEKENKMCARTINLTTCLFVSKYKLNFSNLFI